MNTERRERLFDLHSWVGIISALFVFFVCFTGTVSLFNEELNTWEEQQYRIPFSADPIPIQTKIGAHMDKLAAEGAFPLTVVSFPTRFKPYYESLTPYRSNQGVMSDVIVRWSPLDGSELAVRGKGFSDWMSNLHINLWTDPIVGRSLVGFAGLLLFICILVGLFLHRKLIAAMFVWRPNRGKKLFLRDSHNVLGLWGLLFHLVIAFTGIILGLNSLIGVIFGVLAFDGDHAPHLEPYPASHGAPSGIYAKPLSIDRVREITLNSTGAEPAIIVQFNWGQTNALNRIYYEVDEAMVRYGVLDLNGHSGAVVNAFPTPPGPASRLFASVMPLHLASYAGTWLKLVYAVLGVALCLVTVSGIMIWLERRDKAAAQAKPGAWTSNKVMARLTTGVCSGLPLATMVALYADQLLSFSADSRDFWIGVWLFSTWVGAIAIAFCCTHQQHCNRLMLSACGLLALAAPLLNWLSQGIFPFKFGAAGMQITTATNIVFLIIGVIMLFISMKLRDKTAITKQQAMQGSTEPAG